MKTLNTLNKAVIALVTGAILSTSASAMVSYGNSVAGQPYVGIKAGQFDIDADNVDTDKPTAYGVYGGYNFNQNFGAEVEYITSSDTDYTDEDGKGEFSVDTLGAYATYRLDIPNTSLYGKGKLGFAKTTLDVDDDKDDDTGVAGGLGLGIDVNPNFSIEGEYSILPSVNDKVDTNMLSIGAHLKF